MRCHAQEEAARERNATMLTMRPSMPVRIIFFDAGNTLLHMNYAVIALELQARGVAVTAEDLRRAEHRARVRLDADLTSRVSTESGETHRRYLQYLLDGIGVTDGDTVGAMLEWRRSYNPPVGLWNAPDPEAEPALRLVEERGVRAAVISNSNGSVRRILTELGLARYLEFVLDSGELGIEKPDPRIFQLALDRAGVEPARAIYVGDLYSIDVLGARAVGMTPVLLDPGACWGDRDCVVAPGLLAAVRLAVGELE
jgi:putative hydrolase of the HAD superfamily